MQSKRLAKQHQESQSAAESPMMPADENTAPPMMPSHNTLPIDAVLPALCAAVSASPCVVLSAAPGAGKTTRVPLALLAAHAVRGRIVMLEPRRLAAMRAAQYMAEQCGENVGATVGYRIRGESRVSASTKIEVVTEGVLAGMIQRDPELAGVGLIIFDEFHERSLHADWGLALARDVQKQWRDDLKIVVMSATLDSDAIATLLDNAPIIASEGKSYPVDIIYQDNARINHSTIEQRVAQTVQRAIQNHRGDILIFLPGQREIKRTQTLLESSTLPSHIKIHTLYGEATLAQQQAALQKSKDGEQKIILATSIAETSLTIDGVCVVVDAGLARTAQFDAKRGMSGLITKRVSQATATQRAGRAGRQHAGVCYRLWSAAQHSALPLFPEPEIMHSDLMPLALELAAWGVRETAMDFLDAPPPAHLQQARAVLQQLGALDVKGRITAHGRAMAALSVHPRLAHMLLRAQAHGMAALACEVAALLEERDLLRGEQDVDFYWRWQALRLPKEHSAANRAAVVRVQKQVARLRQLLNVKDDSAHGDEKLGLMLALCYPDRVAKKRDERGERWQLSSGMGAVLPAASTLSKAAWIAVAELDGTGRDARIFLAAALDEKDLSIYLPELFFSGEEVLWSEKDEAVIARNVTRFGVIVFEEKPLPTRGETAVAALCDGLRKLGWSALPLDADTQQWWQRAQWCYSQQLIADFPDFSAQHLLATTETWLAPFLAQISRRSQLSQVSWLQALQARLDYAQQQLFDKRVPSHLTVPSGSRIALDYRGEQPVLPVRLQEMFGAQQTPCIAEGNIPVLIHLLSPRQTPLAVTQDLVSFWQNAYPAVRKDMRGQYPKHYWPENPLEAEPTKCSKAADDRARKRTLQ